MTTHHDMKRREAFQVGVKSVRPSSDSADALRLEFATHLRAMGNSIRRREAIGVHVRALHSVFERALGGAQ